MQKRLAFILLIFLLALTGCSAAAPQRAAAPQSAPATSGGMAPAVPAQPQDSFSGGANKAALPAVDNSIAQAPADARLVIRNASLVIVVEDPGSSLNAIMSMAEKMGGFTVTSNLYKTSGSQGKEYPEATVTVRVPADKLNDALNQIKAQVKDPGKDVQSENVTGQDVTKEYTDLQSQLTNLQSAEAQLREIMASANKTEDVLAVYNQLTQIRGQIEVIKGQIQYYKDSAAMSAISVQIKALAAVQPLEIGGWQPVGVARNAVQALIDTMQFLGSAAIWIILFVLPVGLVIFLPLRLLFWLFFQRNRKKQTPAAPPAAPAD